MNDEREGFFERVKDWAKKNNTTIEDLVSDALGLTINTYNGWRKNKADLLPSATYIAKLAAYMNVSIEWLIYGSESPPPQNKPPDDEFKNRLGAALRGLDDFEKETIAQTAELYARRRRKKARGFH